MRALRYDFVDSGCGDFGLLGDGSICHFLISFLLLVALVLGFDRRQAALVNALVKLALAFAGATIRLAVEELDHLFFVIHPYADGVEHVAVATLVTFEDLDCLCRSVHFLISFRLEACASTSSYMYIIYPIANIVKSFRDQYVTEMRCSQKLIFA